MKLNKAAKLRLFGRITKWSSDKIRFNRKAINDLISCDGEGGGGDIDPATIVGFDTLLAKASEQSTLPITYADFKQSGYLYTNKNLIEIIQDINNSPNSLLYGLIFSTVDSGEYGDFVLYMINVIKTNNYKYIQLNNQLFEIIGFDQIEYYNIYCDKMTIERIGGEEATISLKIGNCINPEISL